MMKVLNRKHAELIMNNKNKQKDMNFSDISYTSDNIIEELSVNSPQYTFRRNPRIYINYNLCSYYRFLFRKVKEMMHEGLIHNFWISNSGIIKIRESGSLTPISVIHENNLIFGILIFIMSLTLEYF